MTPAVVRLRLYDMLGREVGRREAGPQPAGRHELRWPGSGLPAGVYSYRLEAGAARYAGTVVRRR